MPDRVKISGLGLHAAFGDKDKTLMALEKGDHSPCALSGIGAPPFSLADVLKDPKLKKFMSPAAALAVVAASRALVDADLDEEQRQELALFVATGLIDFDLDASARFLSACADDSGRLDLKKMGAEGLRRCHPLLPFKLLLNIPLGMVSIALGVGGENAVYYPGPDQGAHALKVAISGVLSGRFERALVGGAATNTGFLPRSTWRKLGWLAENWTEDGLVPADQAAFVVLEPWDAAPGSVSLRASHRDEEVPVQEVASSGLLKKKARAREDRRYEARGAKVHRWDRRVGHGGASSLFADVVLLARRLFLGTSEGSSLVISHDPEGASHHFLLSLGGAG